MRLIDVNFYRDARILASDMSDFLLLAAHQEKPEKAFHFLQLAIENHNRVSRILQAAMEKTQTGADN